VIIMPVSLPTAADVRKAREQAAKNAAERAEAARTPLLAVLGAGEIAVSAVSKAAEVARARAAVARTRATAQAEDVQHRVAELPQRLSSEELRKTVAELRAQAEQAYAGFAERGEKTWGRIRKQPQVEQALATFGSYTEKLDARVDGLVDDAHDAATKALATVTTQTRSTGERVARASKRISGRTADTVTDVSGDASKAVAKAGAETAGAINEAGDELAHDARSATRRAANRTAPKEATRRPATRRTGTTNGTGPKS
jgi:heparin binding hemagglutinin HbhA